MAYSGLFVRDQLGQTPSSGSQNWCTSPDIIFAGSQAGDPTAYVSTQGYATDYGENVNMGQVNNVYLRALNTTAGATTGRAWFFYAESDLCLFPSNWQTAKIMVGAQNMNYQAISATAANQVCDTVTPFLWTPPPFQAGHSQYDHYCTIAWMENAPVSVPPVSPLVSIPNMNSFNDLAYFVCSHPNMGWRNTNDISAAGPTVQTVTAVTNAAGGGSFSVGIQWQNMPTDGFFAFSVPGPDGPNTVNWPAPPATRVQIPVPTSNVAVPVTWPAKFGGSSVTISYWQGATKPPKGASFSSYVMLPYNALSPHVLRLATVNAPFRLIRANHYDSPRLNSSVNIPGLAFGSDSFTF